MNSKRMSQICLAAFSVCCLSVTAGVAAEAEKWVPFHLPWESPEGSVSDASFLLDAPVGKHGFVTARNGHFYREDGERVRFWGANLSGEGNFPSKEVAPRIADRLAHFGFNIVRLHGLDSGWGKTLFPEHAKDTQHFDSQQLDKLDFLVSELERRGIYINLNLHVGRHFTAADGVMQPEGLGFGKYCVIFDPRMIELQKNYARQLLTHRNPYTGRTYADDPGVVIVELTNENSLFGGWTSGFLRGRQTTRPADAWTDIPPYYGEELTRFYNEWLRQRYPTRERLARAWQEGVRAPGQQTLRNGDFNKGKDAWDFWASKPAAGSLQITNESAGSKACAKAVVTAADNTGWHVMLTQRQVKVETGTKYRVSFRARASASRKMYVEVCHNAPWRGHGSGQFELGDQWQEFEFTFRAPETDADARLSFQLGDSAGTVWISDVVMQGAPIAGLRDDEDPARGTVRRLAPEEFVSVTNDRFRDEARFYFETERRYYKTLTQFLRDELKLRAAIEGTNENYGLPSLRAQALLNVMDCHAYWQHPHFPRKPWSSTDWTITNTPMLDQPRNCNIARLCRSAVEGKPMTVSEYNHPFPNEYGCEMPLLIAAYAGLQDWDAIYGYTFGHRWSEHELSGDVVTGYFDLCNEISKMAQMPTASLMFQRRFVTPGLRMSHVSYTETRELDSLKEKRWDIPQFFTEGELSPLMPLVHRVRIAEFGAQKTTRLEDADFVDPVGRIVSDTKELTWDCTVPKTGRLTIDTPQVQAAIGWTGGQNVNTTSAQFSVRTKFSAVSLAALDGKPLVSSQKILVVAAARCANTGMQWNAERTSISDRWGGAPLLIEAVEGEISLVRDAGASELKMQPLDGTGRPQPKSTPVLVKPGTTTKLPLNAADKTVWWILQP